MFGLAVGLGVLAAVIIANHIWGTSAAPLAAVALAPAVTAILGPPRPTAVVAVAAAVAGFFIALAAPTIDLGGAVLRFALLLAVGVGATLLAQQRESREAKLEEGRTLAQLRRVMTALAGAPKVADVADVVATEGATVLGAGCAALFTVDDDSLELLARAGRGAEELVTAERIPLDAALPAAEVARRRALLSLDRRALLADFPLLTASRMGINRRVMGLPLLVEQNLLGVALFGFSRAAIPTVRERALARALAERCAESLERARLYEASLQSEAHLRILQEVTAALARALTTEDIAAVVLRESASRLGAVAGAVTLVRPEDPSPLSLAASDGFLPGVEDRWKDFPIDADIPVGECLRTNDILHYDDREELLARYPDLAGDPSSRDARAAVWVPVPSGARPAGALNYFFAEPQRFDKPMRELLAAIAAQCGQALERARLLEEQNIQTERARHAARRLEQLGRLTAVLSNALTEADVVRIFMAHAVPSVGARFWALYDLDPDAGVLTLARAETAHDASLPGELSLDDPSGLSEAARTLRPVLWSSERSSAGGDGADPSLGVAADATAEPVAWAAVPLVAYGRGVAVLGLRYDEPPAATAEERPHLAVVGMRCGEALERARLYSGERASRFEAQKAARYLAELQATTAALTGSLTAREVGETVLKAALPALGAVRGAVLVSRGDDVEVVAGHGRRPTSAESRRSPTSVTSTAIASGRVLLIEDVTVHPSDSENAQILWGPGTAGSLAVHPLQGRTGVVGVLAVGWERPGHPGEDRLGVLATLAVLCGQAVERADLFDRDHAIADTLQRSLLPLLPRRVGRLELESHYRPGALGSQVGGDWFDALVLPDDRVCLIVGDVEGRGVLAASAMGQLRAAFRTLSTTIHDPAALLTTLNQALVAEQSRMATMAVALLEPGGTLTYAYAGHPPILVRRADGRVEVLEGGRSVPLGVIAHARYSDASTELADGSILAMFTDGLVERRGASIDDGIRRAEQALAGPAESLAAVADRVLALIGEGGQLDDAAFLIARMVSDRDHLVFNPLRSLSDVRGLRATLGRWLTNNGVGDDDVLAITLAVAEAAVNSLQHAYGLRGGTAEVEVHKTATDIVATVRDSGTWRHEGATTGGKRGLALVRGLTDAVIQPGPEGTTVTMTRRLGRKS